MKKEIVVVGADKKQSLKLCSLLENRHYQVTFMNSLKNVEHNIQKGSHLAMLIDLDNLPVAENFFRDLKEKNPTIRIIGLSKRSFHPELVEAISKHIFACLKKPVNSYELFYLLKSIYENN
jgi:DNA-binding NtrC family response regulator